MLSIYGSITVPDVPNVVVYRDDEDPRKFYMVSGTPRILRSDPRNPASAPMLDLIAYVRDLDRINLATEDVERGHLQMTVGLEIDQADQHRIRAHLRQQLADEVAQGYRFLGIPVRPAEPELSYAPLFVEGSAVATTFDDTLQIAAAATCPALGTGVNSASFSYALTQSGARLIKQAMDQGSLPIQVRYQNLMMIARIPAITIRIHGDRREFLEEARRNAQDRQFLFVGGGIFIHQIWYAPPTLSSFRSTYQSLTIEIDDGDFREADPSDDLTAELEQMAMTVLQNNILPSFFEQAIPASDESEDEQNKGWWLPTETTTVEGTIDVTISRRDVVRINHPANGVIGGNLTPAEAKAAVRFADVTIPNIPIQKLTVLPNINFQIDPIAAVSVFIDYDQFDEIRQRRIRNQKQVLLQKDTVPSQFAFDLAMAADGTAKAEYRYRTAVNFKDSMIVAEHPPNGGWITRSGEFMVVSYAQMGQLKVDLILAPMPPDVASVDLTLTYPDASARGAVQMIALAPAKPTGSYLVTTGATTTALPYRVAKVFRMTDGSALSLPEVEATAQTLTITSPFEAVVETNFVGRGDFQNDVTTIFVTATYRDPAHDLVEQVTLQLDGATRLQRWTVRQIDKDVTDFSYTVRVLRRNGAESVSTHTGTLGGVITVGPSGQDAIEVIVDTEMVDWVRYARVMVTLTYSDPANGIAAQKPMLFSETGAKVQTWSVLVGNPLLRTVRYTVRRVGRNAADDMIEPPVLTDDPFIVLR